MRCTVQRTIVRNTLSSVCIFESDIERGIMSDLDSNTLNESLHILCAFVLLRNGLFGTSQVGQQHSALGVRCVASCLILNYLLIDALVMCICDFRRKLISCLAIACILARLIEYVLCHLTYSLPIARQ